MVLATLWQCLWELSRRAGGTLMEQGWWPPVQPRPVRGHTAPQKSWCPPFSILSEARIASATPLQSSLRCPGLRGIELETLRAHGATRWQRRHACTAQMPYPNAHTSRWGFAVMLCACRRVKTPEQCSSASQRCMRLIVHRVTPDSGNHCASCDGSAPRRLQGDSSLSTACTARS